MLVLTFLFKQMSCLLILSNNHTILAPQGQLLCAILNKFVKIIEKSSKKPPTFTVGGLHEKSNAPWRICAQIFFKRA